MVNILINYECNKSCNFCFQKGMKFDSMMSFENFQKAINWLEQLSFFHEHEKRRITIIGGEPTLNPKLKEMIKLLKERNIKAIMFSNFIFNKSKFELFDKEVIQGFVGTYNPKSWYKPAEFDLMENNIAELRKRGFEVKLSYNITKGNLDYKYIFDACKKHKIKNVRFSMVFPNPNWDNNFINFDDLKKIGKIIISFVKDAVNKGIILDLDCTIPLCLLNGTPDKPSEKDIFFFLKHVNTTSLICKSAIDINPDLSMYYCIPRSKDASVKNILDFNNLREINDVFEEINSYERNELYSFPECHTCKYRIRNVCQGGCLALKNKFAYNTEKKSVKKTINKIIGIRTWGGIGDGILVTPSLKALKEKYPKSELRVLCNKNHKQIFQKNPYIDYLSVSPDESAIENIKFEKFYETNYGKLKPSLNYNKHAMKIIGDLLEVEIKNKKPEIFLTKREDDKAKKILSKYKNPISIHTTSKCSRNKEWPVKNWEKLIVKLADYTFIQHGLKDESLVKGAVDMRGISIREAVAIIKNSKCFVGVESFAAHVTSAYNKKGVVLFGPSNPEIWGHKNNINLYHKTDCSPCLDVIGGTECPHDRKCMNKISVKEVKDAILSIVKKPAKKKSFLQKILVSR